MSRIYETKELLLAMSVKILFNNSLKLLNKLPATKRDALTQAARKENAKEMKSEEKKGRRIAFSEERKRKEMR